MEITIDLNLEAVMAIKILLSALLGSTVGWEREHHGHEAGIRTYGAVTLGACTFGLISIHAANSFGGVDPTRIAAQVVTGIGFIGAGVILRDRGKITGLTTAASLWASAAVGLTVAYGMYILAILNTVILLSLLLAYRLPLSKHKHEIEHPTDNKGKIE